jgi:hypothetical protein
MLNIFSKIAEQKIREAQERGDFKDLVGKGEPLDLADYGRVPEEMRMAYTILKNAGCSPPEVTLKKEIIQIEDMLASITDEQEKYRQIKKLNFLVTKLNLLRNSNINFEEEQRYFPKVVSKISIAPRKDKNSEKE